MLPDGSFLAEKVGKDGVTYWGSETDDGGLVSSDKSVVVRPDGTVEHGKVLPDGTFLKSRVGNDGVTYWGSETDDGGFISEDGKTYIEANGDVDHGKTVDDKFLMLKVGSDGVTYWGNKTADGGFISEDGKTYIDATGKIEHGITTSGKDAHFLPNGTSVTLPSGQVVYGYMTGDDFYSEDGSTIVLDGKTVVNGSMDQFSGIFTSSSGDGYYVGANGITHGTFRDADGALMFDDGSGFVLTEKGWKVDLQQMLDCVDLINKKNVDLSDYRESIREQIRLVEHSWKSPAGDTFSDISTQVTTALDNLVDLVANISARVQRSHDNYAEQEQKNLDNFKYETGGK